MNKNISQPSINTDTNTTDELYRVRQTWENSQTQIGAYKSLENAKKACDKVRDYFVFNSKGEKIYPEEITDKDGLKIGDEVSLIIGATYTSGKAIPEWVFGKKLYLREWRDNGESAIISTVKSGAITGIVATKDLVPYGTSQIASDFKPYFVKIATDVLNVRSGAGTSYRVNTQVKQNQIYTIVAEKDGWGQLKSGAGWISLDYVEKI